MPHPRGAAWPGALTLPRERAWPGYSAGMDHAYDRWSPELRRAVMKVRPQYFGWDRVQRERYGADIPADDRQALEAALLGWLFGVHVSGAEEAEAVIESLDNGRRRRWNEAWLPLLGVGEDAFFLNECLPSGCHIEDMVTLRDYDEAEHAAQEAYRSEEDAAYVPRPYRGTGQTTWARLFIDGAFTYAFVLLAPAHIAERVEEVGQSVLEALLPHDWVAGPAHGRRGPDGLVCWDMRVDAGGLEDVLEPLQDRLRAYVRQRREALLDEWDAAARRGTYLLRDGDAADGAPLLVVCTDKEAMGAIRLRRFWHDCRALRREAAELDAAVATECAAAERFVREQHEALMRVRDPKVRTLRRGRPVYMTPGVFDALDGGSRD
jgi:hypothetical protein